MEDQIRFLNYLQERLNVQPDDLADFLFIDKRTLYNYKNLDIGHLPNKVKEKLIIFFQGYQEFFEPDLSLAAIFRKLEAADAHTVNYIRVKFLEVASIRRKNYIVTNTKELLKKTADRRNIASLDEFLEDVRVLLEYSGLSKGYLYTIFEIIIAKVGAKNDYPFLDYLNKYERKDPL